LDVLEHAYENDFSHNATEVITLHRAMKRLSKEGYRAGRCAIKEGLRETARQLLKQSFQQHPNFKSLFWWIVAAQKLYQVCRVTITGLCKTSKEKNGLKIGKTKV